VAGGASKKKGTRKASAASDAAVDAVELPNLIYQQLANSSSTPTAVAQDVSKTYADPKKKDKAALALINFLLQVSHTTIGRDTRG